MPEQEMNEDVEKQVADARLEFAEWTRTAAKDIQKMGRAARYALNALKSMRPWLIQMTMSYPPPRAPVRKHRHGPRSYRQRWPR